ncbi:MAG: hypothetical protein ACOC2H_07870, partial [Spirochaetota bacterium]
VIGVAGEIRESVTKGADLRLEGVSTDKELKELPLVLTLIHLFRNVLGHAARGDVRYNRYLEKLYIDDIQILHSLIKHLMRIREDARFSVNIIHALRSAVYTITEGKNNGIYMY